MTRLFNYRHNWSDSLKLDYEFSTNVLSSRKFREKRFAERDLPLKTVAFSLMEHHEQLNVLTTDLNLHLHEEWAVADFLRSEGLVSTGGAALDEIKFDVVPDWVQPGVKLLLQNETDNELVEVLTIGLGGLVTLTSDAVQSWFEGNAIASIALIGRFEQSGKVKKSTSIVGELSLSFEVDPGPDSIDAGSPVLTFNDRELWLKKPNWAETVDMTFRGRLETVYFGYGRKQHFSPVAWSGWIMEETFADRDVQTAEETLAFWHRIKGQFLSFYSPTWQPDLPLTIGAALGSSTLVVPGTRISEDFATSNIHRAIIAVFRDGTFEPKKVLSITDNGTNSTLVLDSAWSRAVNVNSAFMVCWLPRWRSATDTLTMEWLTKSVCQFVMSYSVLEDF